MAENLGWGLQSHEGLKLVLSSSQLQADIMVTDMFLQHLFCKNTRVMLLAS